MNETDDFAFGKHGALGVDGNGLGALEAEVAELFQRDFQGSRHGFREGAGARRTFLVDGKVGNLALRGHLDGPPFLGSYVDDRADIGIEKMRPTGIGSNLGDRIVFEVSFRPAGSGGHDFLDCVAAQTRLGERFVVGLFGGNRGIHPRQNRCFSSDFAFLQDDHPYALGPTVHSRRDHTGISFSSVRDGVRYAFRTPSVSMKASIRATVRASSNSRSSPMLPSKDITGNPAACSASRFSAMPSESPSQPRL